MPDLGGQPEIESRRTAVPHDHALVVFDHEDDLLPALGAFVRDGSERNELIVFIHSFVSDEAAWVFLRRAHPVRRDEVVLVSLYRTAFQGDAKRIDHDHVARIVANLGSTAEERGLTAVRIFVDASRRYFSEARDDEWFAFEEWLGRRLAARVALVCAYQRADVTRPDIFPKALRTHAYRFDPKPPGGRAEA